jgi:hypothetical protein
MGAGDAPVMQGVNSDAAYMEHLLHLPCVLPTEYRRGSAATISFCYRRCKRLPIEVEASCHGPTIDITQCCNPLQTELEVARKTNIARCFKRLLWIASG